MSLIKIDLSEKSKVPKMARKKPVYMVIKKVAYSAYLYVISKLAIIEQK